MGHATPKAFVAVDGRTMLARSLDAIISSGVATMIVVAAPEEFVSLAQAEVAEVVRHTAVRVDIAVVVGGADRVESVAAALAAAGSPDIVLVHDAARALTPPAVFERVAAAVAAGAEAVVPVLPMVDTVRRAEAAAPTVTAAPVPTESTGPAPDASPWRIHLDEAPDFESDPPRQSRNGTPPAGTEVLRGDLDRASLRRVQTPQGFAADTLRRAHALYREEVRTLGTGAREATDDAGLVERLGVDVVAVPGDEEALKITYPLDLVLAEHIARERSRT